MSIDVAAAIPREVHEVLEKLREAGYRAVVVGGSLRDMLLGKPPKDFDLATSARPEQVQQVFKRARVRVIPTGIEHGTVTVLHQGYHVEVTTFRAEAEYLDGRRPSKVEFHEDIEADLSRRDFTINAMAWEPAVGIIDPFGGQADLALRLVRCVRVAFDRFSEDGLRPLRAVRFATVLDFTLEAATEAAIPATLEVFKKVAGERVHQELVKILASPRVATGLGLLHSTGLLAAFLPEAVIGNFGALARVGADEPLQLAVLLEGRPKVREIALRLKFPSKIAEEADALVKLRPLPASAATDAELRRWLARASLTRLEPLLTLNAALGTAIEPLATRLRAIAATRPPLSAKELALDGQAIMKVLEVGPSRLVGEATRYLLEQVLDAPSCNSADTLSGLLRQWKSSH